MECYLRALPLQDQHNCSPSQSVSFTVRQASFLYGRPFFKHLLANTFQVEWHQTVEEYGLLGRQRPNQDPK